MRRAALLVCLLVLLAPVAAGAHGDRARGGWVTHRVPSHRFSLALPASWRDLGSLPPGLLERLARENPSLAASIRAARTQQLVAFLAGDLAPSVRSGFLTNVNVIDQPVPSRIDLRTWTRVSVGALRRASVVVRGSLRYRYVTLPAGAAVELHYRERLRAAGRTVDVAVSQWGLLRGGHAYVLTYSVRPSRAGAYAGTFARSARSFRVG